MAEVSAKRVMGLRDHIAEAARAQRVYETAKAGHLDHRIAMVLPLDYRYADRILKACGKELKAQGIDVYQLVCWALVKRLGGTVEVEKVEIAGIQGSFAYRETEEGNIEIKAVDDEQGKPN